MNKRSRKANRRPARNAPAAPRPRISDRIAAPFPDPADDPGSARHDGWNAERKRLFLESLAACGVVEDAARAAGMSKQSAYALRNRACGRAFHLAWNAALQLARRRLADDLFSRAVHGCVEVVVRDGKVWGERHRFDNRLTMSVLKRLDEQAGQDDEDRTARRVAEEYDEFLDVACAGTEAEAADFLADRQKANWPYTPCREARLLNRLDRYRRAGAGLGPADLEAMRRADEEEDEEEESWPEVQPSSSSIPDIREEEEGDEWQPSTSSTSLHAGEEEGDGWQPSTSSTSLPPEAESAPAPGSDGMPCPIPDPPCWDMDGRDIVRNGPQRRYRKEPIPGGWMG